MFLSSLSRVVRPPGVAEADPVPLHELARPRRALVLRLHPGHDRPDEGVPGHGRRTPVHTLQVDTHTHAHTLALTLTRTHTHTHGSRALSVKVKYV